MIRLSLLVATVPLLAACAMHGEVSQQPPDRTEIISRNYQAVYAVLLSQVRTCVRPGTAITPIASVMVEGQLYPDLGYGEVIVGITGFAPSVTSMTKVERLGNQARVEIRTANQSATAARRDQGWIAYWARGGKQCAEFGRLDPPTG